MYDNSNAALLRRADTAGNVEEFDLPRGRYGVGVSWAVAPGEHSVDVDLQCVVVNDKGVIVDCAYYNNMKASRGITHSGDETTGKPNGIQELVWVHLPKLPDNIAVLIFVVAAYSGGSLRHVTDGQLHILEETKKCEIARLDMERSDASVDVVAAMHKVAGGAWKLRVIEEPAQQGQHFMDILPLLCDTIRLFLPQAPKRQKVAFAMEKGGVMDLPQDLGKITVGLGWDTDSGKVDLDVSAVLFDSRARCEETVYFGNLTSASHGIKHSGDNLTGEGAGDDEQISCNLASIGPSVSQIFFCINIYTRGKTFVNVANPYCRVVDDSSQAELCRFQLRDAGRQNALIIARLAREPGNRWGFHALGLPSHGTMFKDSLPDMVRAFDTKTATLMSRSQTTTSLGGFSSPEHSSAPGVPRNQGCGPGCMVQ